MFNQLIQTNNPLMKRMLLFFCAMCIFSATIAQTRQITGKVTGTDNQVVVSATIKIKASNAATITGADGTFSLKAPNGSFVLQVSSVGFASKEVAVSASQAIVNVSLMEQSTDLNEVVVTALGIKREKKSLTYASQQLAGEEIRRAAGPNFMEALSGKVAGIDLVDVYKKTLLVFSIVRFLLASIILYSRHFHNDMLSYVLVFLIFSSIQRFYYQYLYSIDSKSKIRYNLQEYQPLNTFLVFSSSLYIMKYVLF